MESPICVQERPEVPTGGMPNGFFRVSPRAPQLLITDLASQIADHRDLEKHADRGYVIQRTVRECDESKAAVSNRFEQTLARQIQKRFTHRRGRNAKATCEFRHWIDSVWRDLARDSRTPDECSDLPRRVVTRTLSVEFAYLSKIHYLQMLRGQV